ncbi:hypothetical protein [Marinobacter subterrani]|uniref:hypothetical protein n=1 Tax=Marinobacter subterrani TaxID=1658765 RepID=UPI002357B63E|nr:hypothetical protein [Marinobacter subterrani]
MNNTAERVIFSEPQGDSPGSIFAKENSTMSSERKKLSLGNRRPHSKTPDHNSNVTLERGSSIAEELENLIKRVEPDDAGPVVRLKSTDATYNAAGERVILIRRNPFPEKSEYEPAVKYAGHRSLKQWVYAGVSEQYPEEHRLFAERDLLRVINEQARVEFKASRNAWSRYKAACSRFDDEIQHEFSAEDREYKKAQWMIDSAAHEVDMLHEAAGMDRLARITHALQERLIETAEGIRSARVAQILALMDSLPIEQSDWIPENLRSELAVAVTNMTETAPLMLQKLNELRIDWQKAEETETLFTWKRILWTADQLN